MRFSERIMRVVNSKDFPFDITLCAGCATQLLLLVLFTTSNLLRYLLGIMFVLFIPGYVLVSILWPRKDEMEPLERIAISLALSIALVIFIGLFLNFTFGITETSVVLSLYLWIISGSAAVWYRRNSLSPEERFSLEIYINLPKISSLGNEDKALFAAVGGTMILFAATMGYIVTHPPPVEQYTELYILDEDGMVSDYPTNVSVNQSERVIFGVICHEGRETTYRMMVELFDVDSPGEDERYVLYEPYFRGVYGLNTTATIAQNITLNEDERWEENFSFCIREAGHYRLISRLYILEDGNVTEHLQSVWVHVRVT